MEPIRTLATKKDFDKATFGILRYLAQHGYMPRRQLSQSLSWGVTPSVSILALAALMHQGIVEELYTIPRDGTKGALPSYYIMSNYEGELPEGTIRIADALEGVR